MHLLGRVLPAEVHYWISKKSGWMFAAVWIREKQEHVWRWVRKDEYYRGGDSV